MITIEKQSASTRAYTAAGGPQIAAFFDPDTGLAITKPGSQLALSIYPNYYSNKPKVRTAPPRRQHAQMVHPCRSSSALSAYSHKWGLSRGWTSRHRSSVHWVGKMQHSVQHDGRSMFDVEADL